MRTRWLAVTSFLSVLSATAQIQTVDSLPLISASKCLRVEAPVESAQ